MRVVAVVTCRQTTEMLLRRRFSAFNEMPSLQTSHLSEADTSRILGTCRRQSMGLPPSASIIKGGLQGDKRHLLGGAISGFVQVFGRRDDETDHALKRPASKKRQGTKSRAVGQWLAASAMGI